MNSLISLLAVVDPSCRKSFFGIPPWYQYLEVRARDLCAPRIEGINDIWLIGLAFIEIVTRFAVLVAVAFVIYGGIKYSASRGNADKVENAKSTIIDAITGLVIAIVATAAVSFIGRQFSQ